MNDIYWVANNRDELVRIYRSFTEQCHAFATAHDEDPQRVRYVMAAAFAERSKVALDARLDLDIRVAELELSR